MKDTDEELAREVMEEKKAIDREAAPRMSVLFPTEPVVVKEKSVSMTRSEVLPEADLSVARIREMLSKGVDKHEIASKLDMDMEVVEEITIRAKSSTSMATVSMATAPREILLNQLGTALDSVEIAKYAYEEKNSGANAEALAALIGTVQSLIKDISANTSPVEKVRAIEEKVLQPLVRDLIKHLTEEMNRARNDIVKNTDISKHGLVLENFKQGLTGFGEQARLTYEGYRGVLKELMGEDKPKKK